jgi:hypothetical protein
MHRTIPVTLCATTLALAALSIVACGGPTSSTAPTSVAASTASTGVAASTAPTGVAAPASNSPPRVDPSKLSPTATYTIGFSSLHDNRATFATQLESGFTVSVVSGDWVSITTYGNPQPFVQFTAPAGTTVTGELRVTANGAPFWLNSFDLYSSTTKIPYVIEGTLNSEPAFTVMDTVGKTFGAFARRTNPKADMPVQELRIRLSNPSAPCCSNPMGIDNIVVSR